MKAKAGGETVSIRVIVRRRAVELIGSPRIADGVMTLKVRTRVAGRLSLRVDSRSRYAGRAGQREGADAAHPGHHGLLARLTLRLRPAKATALPGLSVRKLVLVSPLAAG